MLQSRTSHSVRTLNAPVVAAVTSAISLSDTIAAPTVAFVGSVLRHAVLSKAGGAVVGGTGGV
jgi:hypothetical protein